MKLRGRDFTAKEIKQIERLTNKYYARGRTFISIKICEELQWKQPNGWLKDRACREVLRTLDVEGHIKLPKSLVKKRKKREKTANSKIPKIHFKVDKAKLETLKLSALTLKQVKGTKEEIKWNWLVNKYHYLGFKTFVGRAMKYFIYYDERIIGAIGFCEPAFNLFNRNEILRNEGVPKQDIKQYGINNGRFLIFPWVNVPNLASYILAYSTKTVMHDWEKYYNVKPIFIETFVNPRKFYGTCYKADNWTMIGKSKGYKKSGVEYSNSQVPKLIFMKIFKQNISQYKKRILS